MLYRIEIVTHAEGLERSSFIHNMFPDLFAAAHSQFYTIYCASGPNDISKEHRSILDDLVEEGEIIDFTCAPDRGGH